MKKFAVAMGLVLLLSGCASIQADKTRAVSVTTAEQSRPNIIVIMLDDMGFSDLGFLGSKIRTPHLDALARGGRTFTQFYSYPRCSPTRAAFLTGHYPHQAGLAFLTAPAALKLPEGPYQGYLSRKYSTLAEQLKPLGYRNYLSGKWHVGERQENWPTKRGFDSYFGLISGASSYYELLTAGPTGKRTMARNGEKWAPPADGFYMTDAITGNVLDQLDNHARDYGDRPAFLYLAYTAPHWPLHAPESEIAKYDGVFDSGWEKLHAERLLGLKKAGLGALAQNFAPLPSDLGRWQDEKDKAGWARKMQVYAAMMTIADKGIGQVIAKLKQQGRYEDSLILVFSDNGASSETVASRGLNNPEIPIGRRGSYVAYGPTGAALSNTPFKGFKGSTYEGGIRSPLIVHWPRQLAGGGAIDQKNLLSVLDLNPSLLAAAGGTANGSKEGIDRLAMLIGEKTALANTLFWEHLGWRGVRNGKWKAVAKPSSEQWELYDLSVDPGETNNLSTSNPEVASRLATDWQKWADRVGVKAFSMEELMQKFFPRMRAPKTSLNGNLPVNLSC